jgi:two-component system, NtrC family, sensor kinase
MALTLRRRLATSVGVVVLVMGLGSTIIGTRLFGDSLLQQVQRQVEQDLNTAFLVYNTHLNDIETRIVFLARDPDVVAYATGGRRTALAERLETLKRDVGFDVLTLTDADGVVIARSSPALAYRDSQTGNEVVARVIDSEKPARGTVIVPARDLALESEKLAGEAKMTILETPRARPSDQRFLDSGMMLEAGAPVFYHGGMLGVLYGGTLLNRSTGIVDEVKRTAYGSETWRGKDIGTATIFQNDVRISTNVKAKDGGRAVGTRVSEEVYNRVVRDGRRWIARAFVVDDWYLTAYGPIRDLDDKVVGMLYVGVLAGKFEAMRARTVWTFVGVSIAGMVIALLVASMLANGIVRPVRDIVKASEKLAKGSMDAMVEVDPNASGELAELSRTFNSMVRSIAERDERLQESAKKITESKKLATLGQLAAGIAHEINNPLGGIVMYSHMLKEDLVKEQNRENVEKIAHEADRCKTIVKGLLDFARQTKPERTESSINHVMNEVVALLEQQAIFHNIKIVRELSPSVPLIEVDVGQMQEVLMNLVLNAAQAMDGEGTLTLKTGLSEDASYVEIEVRDTGPGIPPDKIDKIFEPFYTTKEVGRGTGLGLSIAYGIVERHHGSISVESEVGVGTTFLVRLPVPPTEPGM